MELLERTSQLQALNSALAQAKAGQGCIALVYGEAGIGKTSLVEHFVNENKKSWRILSGACDSLFTPRPLGPLHDIAIQTGGKLSALLDSESNRQAIFSACLNELKNQNSILVTEDVHWADEATLDLLKYLGRRIRQTTSLMILTYRDDEIGMDHPLRFLLGDLASSHALHRIPVSSLSKDAVHELAKNKKIDPVALHHMTNGNPFFVTEVLAVESGIPETVRDAVLARAARLSLPARSVLEATAVIGSRAEPWLLSNIVGVKSAYVEECISKGMVQTQDDYYAFRHELARQTILESTSPQRKITLHHRILNALKESSETRNDLARLANHAEGTKDVNVLLAYVPAAARQASAAGSHREAAALYELALRFADTLMPAERAQMLEAYAVEAEFTDTLTPTTVYQEAIELWHAVGNRLKEGKDLAEFAQVLITFGQETKAIQASQAATILLEAFPKSIELAMAYRARCFILWSLGDYAEAASWGEKAVALAERCEDATVLASACNYFGCAMMGMDFERGRVLLERSLAIARQANLEYRVASALGNLVRMSSEMYQFADADRYLVEGIAFAVEHDDDYHALEMLSYQALTRLYEGHWADVAEAISRTLEGFSRNIVTRINVQLALGRLRVRQGNPNTMPTLDEALILSKQENAIQHLGSVRAARAEAAWLAGNNDRVLTEARAVYDLSVSKRQLWVAGELAFWRWRAGDDFVPPSWIAKPFALQIAGDWRAAAKEWGQYGCPYEQATALMDGDESAQLSALEIFEHLGARPITEKLKQIMRAEGVRSIPRGPRPVTRENPFGLTSREMEVLACLVNGLSNNAIARKLSISSRTTEHHIAAILDKLGVESRSEAIVLALQHHLLGTE